MSGYQERLDRWARSLVPREFPPAAFATIEADTAPGCPTCGYGSDPELEVRIGGEFVRSFAFGDLPTILEGLLLADPMSDESAAGSP